MVGSRKLYNRMEGFIAMSRPYKSRMKCEMGTLARAEAKRVALNAEPIKKDLSAYQLR